MVTEMKLSTISGNKGYIRIIPQSTACTSYRFRLQGGPEIIMAVE
jgi:hypothetical protein